MKKQKDEIDSKSEDKTWYRYPKDNIELGYDSFSMLSKKRSLLESVSSSTIPFDELRLIHEKIDGLSDKMSLEHKNIEKTVGLLPGSSMFHVSIMRCVRKYPVDTIKFTAKFIVLISAISISISAISKTIFISPVLEVLGLSFGLFLWLMTLLEKRKLKGLNNKK